MSMQYKVSIYEQMQDTKMRDGKNEREMNEDIFSREVSDRPCAEIHFEIVGDTKKFLDNVIAWRELGDSFFGGVKSGDVIYNRFLVCYGNDEKCYFSRIKAEEIIYLLLYYCKVGKASEVKVREINYNGKIYTDISDVVFLEGIYRNPDSMVLSLKINNENNESNIEYERKCTYAVKFHAKTNDGYSVIYIFGSYIYEDDNFRGFLEKLNWHLDWQVEYSQYPLSTGLVEVKEDLLYLGRYKYYFTYWYGEGMRWAHHWKQVFCTTDGKDIVFKALLDGKLYKLISKNDERVVFHDLSGADDAEIKVGNSQRLFIGYDEERIPPRSPWSCKMESDERKDCGGDIIFRNTDGEYRYSIENKESITKTKYDNVKITIPQMPDNMDRDSACRLFEDYIRALEDAFPDGANIKKRIESCFKI